MASRYSIAIEKVQKDFSRYFKVETKPDCIWKHLGKHNESFNEDDDLLTIQAEIQMMNPLNGSNKDGSLNNDCSSTVTNSITNTLFLPQTESSDQKKDENSAGIDSEDRSDIEADPINSTQELMNVLEADVGQDKSKTDGTQDLCCLVDYWNKSADITEGEAEADETIESLMRALTKFGNSNLEFDPVCSTEELSAVVADAGKRIDLIGDAHEKMKKSTDIVNFTLQYDANGTGQKVLSTGISDQQVGGNIQQVCGNMQEVFDNGQQGEGNGQQVDNERQASYMNDELNQYITFYEQKRNEGITTDIDLGLNEMIDRPIIRASDKIDVSNPSTSSKVGDSITQSQNQQQSFVSYPPLSIDEPFVFDCENNITSNQYRIMYEVVSDPNDPTKYVLRPSTSENLTNLVSANLPLEVSFGTSLDALMRLVKPCFVLLKDCLVKQTRKSIFDNFRAWAQSSNQALPQKPAGIKRYKKRNQHKAGVIKPKRTKATKKSRKSDLIQKKHEIIIAPSPPLPPEIPKIITNLTGPTFETTTLPMANQPITTERKNVLINNWLQESSQATPDKFIDVNELFQDANLLISSDIEDAAFQLAKYMDSNDQTNNNSQTANSIKPTSSNVPRQLNEKKSVNSRPPWNAALKSVNSFEQPLDLSMKETTSISTDTGFGNDSPPSYQSPHEVSRDHSKVVVDNSIKNNTGNGIINNFTSNICTEDHKTSHLHKNQREQYNSAENNLKKREHQTKNLPSICAPKPTTATDSGRKKKSSSAECTLLKKKKRPTPEQKPALRSKERTSKEQILFHQSSSSADLTNESSGHSTDLDYETSDDVTNSIEKTLDDKIKLTHTVDQKKTFATGTVPNNHSNKRERLVIKIPNNEASSSRIVVVGESSSPQNVSQAKINTKVVSTPVNVVELPPVVFSKNPKPDSTIAPVQIIRDLQYGMIVPPGPQDTLKRQILYVFDWPCLIYLNGKDCGVVCTFNHDLPPPSDILGKATLFSNIVIMYMYNIFIAKSIITFNFYFDMICEMYGSRKMKESLVNAISDCEKHKKISFFKCIYRGLVMTGLSKRDALTKIAECSCKTRSSSNVILEIMIEDDALYFIDMLKQYYWHGTINSTYMLKLLQQVLNNQAPSLVKVFVDILDKYSISDVCDVSTLKLIILKAAFLVIGDLNLTRKWKIIESRIK